MDKTTTWLVRGAAIVVISSGVIALFSFLKPNLKQFNLSKEEKEKIAIEKAEKRCKDFDEFIYAEFETFYLRDQIKEVIMYKNFPIFFETTFGRKFNTDIYPDKDLMNLLASKNIPVKVGINLMCK